jgi:hypothetical protein
MALSMLGFNVFFVWGWAVRFMVVLLRIIIWVPTRKPAFNGASSDPTMVSKPKNKAKT